MRGIGVAAALWAALTGWDWLRIRRDPEGLCDGCTRIRQVASHDGRTQHCAACLAEMLAPAEVECTCRLLRIRTLHQPEEWEQDMLCPTHTDLRGAREAFDHLLRERDDARREVVVLTNKLQWEAAANEVELQRVKEERDRYRAEWEHAKKQAEPILGYRFVLGPQVTPPIPVDFTEPRAAVLEARCAWATALREAVQEHDAWGLLRTRPDGDVTLYDTVTHGSFWDATGRGGTIHLLLAREAH